MTTTAEPRVRRVMRRVNEMMWESLARGGYAEPIAFFCECADPECYQPVWLTATDYERARTDPEFTLLAAGHVHANPATSE